MLTEFVLISFNVPDVRKTLIKYTFIIKLLQLLKKLEQFKKRFLCISNHRIVSKVLIFKIECPRNYLVNFCHTSIDGFRILRRGMHITKFENNLKPVSQNARAKVSQ